MTEYHVRPDGTHVSLEMEDRLAKWKEITAHVIALALVAGFFGVFLALAGVVAITDPTTATFIGTVTGYAIGQLSRPLAFYFAVAREPPANGKTITTSTSTTAEPDSGGRT